MFLRVKPLPANTILVLSKLKAFADGKLDIIQNVIYFFQRPENIVSKENAGYQHFSPFPTMLYFFLRGVESCHCVEMG